ncbi:protein yellow [Cylas formicarius]|uniref:protein yellow n=1 Tax=Cylas formicarius TaxID=197179 RepID=UPI002958991A|nr:protein yellow [Cylas formicarius]
MGIYSVAIVIGALAVGAHAACCDKNLIQDLSFKLSGYNVLFPCPSTKNIYASSGRYIPKNIIPTRFQILNDYAIVALSKFRPGVPFTLAKFSLRTEGCVASLEPYPCWNIQEEGNCKAIQNAVDVALDAANNLWVLDTGIVNTLEQPVRRCAPKLWGLNTETGEVIKSISLEQFTTNESNLQYLIVDITSSGSPVAFISDAGAGALIAINLQAETGYRLVLPPAVSEGCGVKDVLYVQLARKESGNVLYFTYLGSPKLFSIKAEYLEQGSACGAVVEVGRKPPGTGLVLLGTDNGENLFVRFKGHSDIYVWNTCTEFSKDKFVLVQAGDDCRMATQVVPGYRRLMWTLESNFHDFVCGRTGCVGPSVVIHPLVKTDH